MQSPAPTVEAYLASLPADRRAVIEAVRKVLRANLDPLVEEGMQYGMVGYYVPHSVFPAGYHCDPRQPLPFAALAAQKNGYSVYLMPLYMQPERVAAFEAAWKATGRKLDMGKSCVRFKRLEDAALDVLGATVRAMKVADYIATYEATLAGSARRGAKKAAAKKPAAKKAAAKKPAAKKAAAKKPAAKKAAAKKPAPRRTSARD